MLSAEEKERGLKALASIVMAIIDTVNELPQGAPSGVVYAGCMHVLTLNQYERIIAELVSIGKIKQSGHLLLPA